MTTGAKIALASVALFVIAISGEVLYLHHQRAEDANRVVARRGETAPTTNLDDDDMVMLSLHKERPDSLKDERTLIGKTLWVSAAEQLDYYKATGNHVDYAHPVGVLEGGEPLVVQSVFEQKAPATGHAVLRIPAGEKQVLLGFTLPKSDNPKQLYATPVGDYEGGVYLIKTDDLFFYSDPRTLFHWSPAVWEHIDKHEVVPGMTENQSMMSVGQVLDFHGDTPGNRSITFQHLGHPVTVTFVNGRATTIVPGS